MVRLLAVFILFALGTTASVSAQTSETENPGTGYSSPAQRPPSPRPAPARPKQPSAGPKQSAEPKQLSAEAKKSPEAPPRPLQISDAASWKKLGTGSLSPDGQWFAYRVATAAGESEMIVKQTRGDKQYKFPGIDGSFSADSRWFVLIAGVRSGEPPALAVALVNLASGEPVVAEEVREFAFSGEGVTHFALHRALPPAPKGPPAPGTPPPSGGSDLLLFELATGSGLTLGNVAEFAFDKKGDWLALALDVQGQVGNGIQLRNMKTAALHQLDLALASYQGLRWTDKGDGLTVLRGVAEKGKKGKLYSILGFTGFDGPAPQRLVYDPHADKTFPAGMTISPHMPSGFSDDLAALFFGIHEAPKPEAQPDPANPATGEGQPKEKPDLILWHWRDDRPQPKQQLEAENDRLISYLCCYRVGEKKFLRLADDEVREVIPVSGERWAVGFDLRAYRRQAELDGKVFCDVSVSDLHTGQRRLAVKKLRVYHGPIPVEISPAGTHFVYYDDGHFHSHDLATGKTVRLTANAPVSFIDTEDDHNIDRPPTKFAGWAKDGSSVLLSDKWDIWQFPVQGGPAINLTVNGRKMGIRYSGPLHFNPEEHGFDLSKPLHFRCDGEWTKKSGLVRKHPSSNEPVWLYWDDAEVGGFKKAREADIFVFARQTWTECPEFYVCDATFRSPQKLTNVGAEHPKVAWSSGARLIDYTSTEGDRLQAALFLPANYEKGKTYPTVVYIYERLSQNLHGYSPPSVYSLDGLDPAIYTSNGYAVLMPDIKYKVNDPGMSALGCVLPALEAAVKTGVVDRARVGLLGHSWGGYQTAFLITQTDAFKAAVAGAPLTNLVSMYNLMYGRTGSPNQPQFESGQARFTSGYLDNLEAYMRNSPVFHARNVKTPLLLMHNDTDEMVDFTQGLEFFNALRRLDKPVVMLSYKGEKHNLRKPANQRDYAERMREFFDHHLMGKPAPAWLKDGVPHLKLDEHLTERLKNQ